MIPVAPAPEPARFDVEVRQRGVLALHERIGALPPSPRTAGKACERAKSKSGGLIDRFEDLEPRHLPDYWTAALDDLYAAYHQICAYCCFRIHPITGARSVDHMDAKSLPGEGSAADEDPHMVAMSTVWDHVYEWHNYRLASGRLNARKSDYQDVIDPFEVGAGWFEMEFVGFQLKPGREVDVPTKARMEATIERLGLNSKTMRGARESDYRDYIEGHISLDKLRRESPLVAREVTRAGKLRPADRPETPSQRG